MCRPASPLSTADGPEAAILGRMSSPNLHIPAWHALSSWLVEHLGKRLSWSCPLRFVGADCTPELNHAPTLSGCQDASPHESLSIASNAIDDKTEFREAATRKTPESDLGLAPAPCGESCLAWRYRVLPPEGLAGNVSVRLQEIRSAAAENSTRYDLMAAGQ